MGTQGSSTQTSNSPSDKSNGKSGANASSSSQASASAVANVNLTTQQKTEIHNTIINNNSGPRVTNLNITPAPGVAVPQGVQFVPLPQNIISMQPAWAGLAYFLFHQEIVLIDPHTRRIVAIIG